MSLGGVPIEVVVDPAGEISWSLPLNLCQPQQRLPGGLPGFCLFGVESLIQESPDNRSLCPALLLCTQV